LLESTPTAGWGGPPKGVWVFKKNPGPRPLGRSLGPRGGPGPLFL